MAGTNPLAQVIKGDKNAKDLTENQAKSALAAAVNKIDKGTKTAATLKANGKNAVGMIMHTAETHSTLFLASMAEGFAVSKGKSLKLGPVDVRVLAGVPMQAWGIGACLMGKGGGHQLAVGNGLIGSAVASLGLQAGQALAEKRAGGAANSAAPDASASTAQIPEDNGITVSMTPTAAGDHREVLLHPSAEGHHRRPKKRKRLNR